MKYLLITILLSVITTLSCTKDEEVLTGKTILNPKSIINNTSGWYISLYNKSLKDSTILFSKYVISFNEDSTCAERIKFISPFIEVYGIWDTYDYPYSTVIYFWIPEVFGFDNINGEWNINHMSKEKIVIFRLNNIGEYDKIVFQKL